MSYHVESLDPLTDQFIVDIRMDKKHLVFITDEGEVIAYKAVRVARGDKAFFDKFINAHVLLAEENVAWSCEIGMCENYGSNTEQTDSQTSFAVFVDSEDGPVEAEFTVRALGRNVLGGWIERLTPKQTARLKVADIPQVDRSLHILHEAV